MLQLESLVMEGKDAFVILLELASRNLLNLTSILK